MARRKNKNRKSQTTLPTRRQREGGSSPRSATSGDEDKSRYEAKSRLFSRNRTLAKLDNSGGKDGESSRATTHQLRRERRSISWWLLGSLGVVMVIGLMVYQMTAEVTVSLRGSLDVLADANQTSYRQTIDEYFSKRPLERFRGLMHPRALSEYLQQNGHNEVVAVASIDFLAVGRTSVVLEAREPVARWIIDKNVQFVDKSGNTFMKNYFSSPHIKIVDKSGVTLAGSQTATSGRFLGFIGKSIGALEKSGHKVKEVVIPPSTTRQIQLRVDGGVLVKMAIDRPVGEQTEDASRALQHLASKRKKPSYIDVRVANKAYYR